MRAPAARSRSNGSSSRRSATTYARRSRTSRSILRSESRAAQDGPHRARRVGRALRRPTPHRASSRPTMSPRIVRRAPMRARRSPTNRASSRCRRAATSAASRSTAPSSDTGPPRRARRQVVTLAPRWARSFAITYRGRALRLQAAIDIAEISGRSRAPTAAQVVRRATKASSSSPLVGRPATSRSCSSRRAALAKRIAPDEVADLRQRPARHRPEAGRHGRRGVHRARRRRHRDRHRRRAGAAHRRSTASPVQGRGAGGVAGINVRGDGAVVGGGVVIGETGRRDASPTIGPAKATEADDIPSKGRGTGGVRLARFPTMRRASPSSTSARSAACTRSMAADDSTTQTDPNPRGLPALADQTRPREQAQI